MRQFKVVGEISEEQIEEESRREESFREVIVAGNFYYYYTVNYCKSKTKVYGPLNETLLFALLVHLFISFGRK